MPFIYLINFLGDAGSPYVIGVVSSNNICKICFSSF